jgi:hypothetical protein
MKSVETSSSGHRVETYFVVVMESGAFLLIQEIFEPGEQEPRIRNLITLGEADLPVLRDLVSKLEKQSCTHPSFCTRVTDDDRYEDECDHCGFKKYRLAV